MDKGALVHECTAQPVVYLGRGLHGWAWHGCAGDRSRAKRALGSPVEGITWEK